MLVVTNMPLSGRTSRHFWTHENTASLDNPVTFDFEGGKTIYNLPNGLQAYGVSAGDGLRLADIPVGFVGFPQVAVSNAASCFDCHGAGLLPVTDSVRQLALTEPARFDPQALAAIDAQYLPRPDFAALIAEGSAIHVSALAATGVTASSRDPLAIVSSQFEELVSTARVAGELGVTPDQLARELEGSQPLAATPLKTGGSLERQLLLAMYAQALCSLHATSEVRPANCP